MKNFFLKYFIFFGIAFFYSCKKEEKKLEKWSTVVKLSNTDSRFTDLNTTENSILYAIAVEGVSGKQSLWYSKDSGNNWSFNSFIFKDDKITSIAIKDNLIIGAGNFIYKSFDEGLTWSSLFVPFEGAWDVQLINKDIVVVGNANTIKRSINQGQSWSEVFVSNFRARFKKFSLTNNKTLFAIAGDSYDNTNFGIIAKSIDEGISWRILENRFSNITDLYFLNDRVGFIFTFNKELYKTLDGGINWSLINNKIPDSYPSSFFLSDKEAFIGCNNEILHTIDGGLSWELEYSENGLVVNKITKSGDFLYLITNDGKILKRKI